MTDDAHLLRQYCETKSEAAFAELVERHLGLVYRAALRQLGGNVHWAQDIAQTVFLLLAQKARSLQGHTSLAGWLYTTTHFKAAEALRTERRRKLREEAALTMNENLAEFSSDADPERRDAIMDQVILELNERDREVILLRFFEGHAYAEIAERISLTEKAAHKRVERALVRLREMLGQRGITSGSAAFEAMLAGHAVFEAPAGLSAKVVGAAMAFPGPAPAMGVLKLMTTAKITTSIAAVAGLLVAGLAVHETSTLRRMEIAVANSEKECTALTEQMQQLDQKAEALAADQRAASSEFTALGSDPAFALGETASNPSVGTKFKSGTVPSTSTAALDADPEVHELLGKLAAWNNTHYIGPLLQSAGLSPAQVQRAEYLIDQQVQWRGFVPDALSLKTDPRTSGEISAEIRQTIGDAGVAAVNKYLVTRQVTEGLAGVLYDGDNPLTTDQATQLTQVLASTNQRSAGTGWYVPQDTDWAAALAQSARFLSPDQLAQLKNLATGRFGSTTP